MRRREVGVRVRHAVELIAVLAALTTPGVALAQGSVKTELKLGVDRAKVRADRLRKIDNAAVSDVLDRRVASLGTGGQVEVRGIDEIRLRVPLEKVTEAQVRMLTRPGRLEFRRLDDIYTNLNPDGRYLIDVLTVQQEQQLRFRDRRTNQPVPTDRIVAKAPLLFDNGDLEPGGAQAVSNGALVRVRLTAKASKRLESFLKKPGRLTAVLLDGEVVAISAGVTTITPKPKKKDRARDEKASEEPQAEVDVPGGFRSAEEAGLLADTLNAGVLPFPLTVRSQQIVPD